MDDDSTPMSRSELAMLWDLLNRWLASHRSDGHQRLSANILVVHTDAELTERLGG